MQEDLCAGGAMGGGLLRHCSWRACVLSTSWLPLVVMTATSVVSGSIILPYESHRESQPSAYERSPAISTTDDEESPASRSIRWSRCMLASEAAVWPKSAARPKVTG